MLSSFFLALFAFAGPDAQAYPTKEILGAFASVCGDTSSAELVEIAAGREGWEKFEPREGSQLAKLMAFGKGAAAKMGVTGYDEANFRRLVAGRTLELAVTQVGNTTGCRVYDFAATTPLDHQALQGWAKRAPSAKVEKPGIMISATWEPGVIGNADKTQIAFFPVGSPLSTTMHLSGLALMAQSTGDTE